MRRTTVSPYPLLRDRLEDRQVGHSAVMASLPSTLGADARSKVHCLWRYDTGVMHVQAACEIRSDVLGRDSTTHDVPLSEPGSRWRITVDVNCQKTPSSDVPAELRPILKESGRCYRSRSVVVPEDERQNWCVRRFARLGFAIDPSSLSLSDLRIADLGRRGGGIPYVRVTADGLVLDAEAWNAAIRDGVGKGRNFGLGLVISTPIVESELA